MYLECVKQHEPRCGRSRDVPALNDKARREQGDGRAEEVQPDSEPALRGHQVEGAGDPTLEQCVRQRNEALLNTVRPDRLNAGNSLRQAVVHR